LISIIHISAVHTVGNPCVCLVVVFFVLCRLLTIVPTVGVVVTRPIYWRIYDASMDGLFSLYYCSFKNVPCLHCCWTFIVLCDRSLCRQSGHNYTV